MATVEGVEGAVEGVAAPEAAIVETKVTRPRLRSEQVARRELLARLRDGMDLPGFDGECRW